MGVSLHTVFRVVQLFTLRLGNARTRRALRIAHLRSDLRTNCLNLCSASFDGSPRLKGMSITPLETVIINGKLSVQKRRPPPLHSSTAKRN